MGVNIIKNIKIWLFQNVEKIQNKVEVSGEIGCGNELKSLRKKWRQKMK